jgi:hypothetical protein
LLINPKKGGVMKRIYAIIWGVIFMFSMAGQAGAVAVGGGTQYLFTGQITSVLGTGDGLPDIHQGITITVNLDGAGLLQSWGYTIGSGIPVFYNSIALNGYTNTVIPGSDSFSLTSNSNDGSSAYTLWYGVGKDYLRYFFSGDESLYTWRATLEHMERREAASTPIPAAAWLLGSGLLGLIGIGKRSYFGNA